VFGIHAAQKETGIQMELRFGIHATQNSTGIQVILAKTQLNLNPSCF
jgi:hypothetical protein